MPDSLVNLDYLIESSLNDEDYVKMMIELYIKNTPNYLESISSLEKENNLEELKKVAHKFKASVSIIGIEKATVLIQELENNITNNENIENTKNLVTSISEYCKQSLVELNEILQSGKKLCP